ncbi:hypothetical protein V5O48_000249 [Marasmius crinis-equi]|uniref:DUF6534 domain-containing protein n=1 Tax=Marasmius crinis-equi TaxID=585013 RepID=A0ABR3G262_9AGAR
MPTILLRSVAQGSQGSTEAIPSDFGDREPLFVGHLVLLALFGVLSLQICIYYIASAARDKAVVRAVVYGTYILLVVQVIMSANQGIMQFVHGDRSIGLAWFYVPVIGGIVGFGVQVLYAWRISILSQSKVGPLLLVALSVISAAAAFASAYFGTKLGSVEELAKSHSLPTATAVWNCTSALCDLLIAGSMTYLLMRDGSATENTRIVARKVVQLSIETNALTTAVAIANAAALLKNQNYNSVFSLILPSLYGNTLLAMMNFRIILSQRLRDNVASGSGISSLGSAQSQLGYSHRNQRLSGTHGFTPLSSLGNCHGTDPLRSPKDKQSDGFEYSIRLQDLQRPDLEIQSGHAI